MFIAEGGEECFLEGLIPADLAGAGGEFLAFALESDQGGLMEKVAEHGIGPVPQDGLAAAAQRLREEGVDPEPMAQFVEGRIELTVQDQGGQRGWFGGGGFPDDVELDPAIGGIDVMAVAMPGRRVQIDFDVAGFRKITIELDQCVAEIGASLVIPKTRVKDLNGASVQGDEAIAAKSLMLPDRLKKTLRGDAVGRFLEPEGIQGLGTPLGVVF